MVAAERFALAALLALAFVLARAPVRADEVALPMHGEPHPVHADAGHPAHPEADHACLNQKERRAETETGRLIRLSAAMRAAKHRMPGTVVRARLCHGHGGLVYVLTVLARDGKVARIAVDAVKGTVGDR
jgi:hypothetical protein